MTARIGFGHALGCGAALVILLVLLLVEVAQAAQQHGHATGYLEAATAAGPDVDAAGLPDGHCSHPGHACCVLPAVAVAVASEDGRPPPPARAPAWSTWAPAPPQRPPSLSAWPA